MIIFSCSPPDDTCIAIAKDWISKSNLDRDTIRLVRNDRYVAVIHEGDGYIKVMHGGGQQDGGAGVEE